MIISLFMGSLHYEDKCILELEILTNIESPFLFKYSSHLLCWEWFLGLTKNETKGRLSLKLQSIQDKNALTVNKNYWRNSKGTLRQKETWLNLFEHQSASISINQKQRGLKCHSLIPISIVTPNCHSQVSLSMAVQYM